MKKGNVHSLRKVRNNKVKKKRKTMKRKSTYKRKKNKNKKRTIKQKGGNLEKILAVGAGVVLTGALAGVFKDKIPFDSSKKHNKNPTSHQSSSQHPQEYSQSSTDVAAIEDGHKNLIRMAISLKPSVKKELEAMELEETVEEAASKASFYIQDYRARKVAVGDMLKRIDNLEDVLNEPWEILLVMEKLVKDEISEDNEQKYGDKSGYFLNIPSIRNTIEKIKNLKDDEEEPGDLRTVSSYAQQIIPNLLKAYFLFKFMETPDKFMETPDVETKFSEFWTKHNHSSFEAAINKIKLTKSKGEKPIEIPDVKEIFYEANNEMTKIITYIDEYESTKNSKELIDYIKDREVKLFEDDVHYPDFFYKKIIENYHQH